MRAGPGTLRVVVIYAVFAALWILVSDHVVVWLFRDPDQIAIASTIKGWLFVAVTSLLLYRLIRRLLHANLVSAERAFEAQAKSAALLREGELFKQAVLNSVDAEIAVLDRYGTILAVNDPWRHFSIANGIEPGSSPACIEVGANYLDICRKAAGASAVGAREACEGIQAVLDGRQSSFRMDYACHSPKQQRWFTMTVTPLAVATQAGCVISHTDITWRTVTQERLRASEERLRLVIERSTVGIALSRDGITLGANPEYLRMFGYEREDELSGTPLIEQIAPQCRPDILDRLKRRADGRAVESTYESVGLRKDGSQFPFLVSGSRIMFPDGPTTIAFFVDITERKRKDALISERNALLEKQKADLEETLSRIKRLEGMLSICIQCKKIRTEKDDWHQLERYLVEHTDAVFSHGLCPTCFEQQKAVALRKSPPPSSGT